MKPNKSDRLLSRCEHFLSTFVEDNFLWDSTHVERTCLGCNATPEQPHRSGCVVAGAMELLEAIDGHLGKKAAGVTCGTFDPKAPELLAAIFAKEADATTK